MTHAKHMVRMARLRKALAEKYNELHRSHCRTNFEIPFPCDCDGPQITSDTRAMLRYLRVLMKETEPKS